MKKIEVEQKVSFSVKTGYNEKVKKDNILAVLKNCFLKLQ